MNFNGICAYNYSVDADEPVYMQLSYFSISTAALCKYISL